MSTHIAFDTPFVDTVTFSIAPFDTVSGAVVAHLVSAAIDGLPDRPIRNRSGLLVFVNLPPQQSYTVALSATRAGYFDPPPLVCAPPPAAPGNADQRRFGVPLMPRPNFPFAEATALIRGTVRRGGVPVEGAAITTEPYEVPDPDHAGQTKKTLPFATHTDAGGSFALPLRRLPFEGDEVEAPGQVVLNFADGIGTRNLTKAIVNGKEHVFAAAIDLDGVNDPEFLGS